MSLNTNPRPMEGVQERGHGNEVASFNFEEKRQQLNWKLNLVSQVPTLLMNRGENGALNVTNPREEDDFVDDAEDYLYGGFGSS
ncbi:unnamed protein product [Caenorhabditis sp. 36 PRJEB53466]|nr:unnamed protein product [Caenorhabditis sp. 36 PRJEB53466]